jgi:hypothetical protein
MSRCKRALEENTRAQYRQAHVWQQISQEMAAVASHLIRSHISSHPELRDVLAHNGAPSFAAGNSATSTNSNPPGSPPTRPSDPHSPRGPQLGPSSGLAPVSEISSDSSGPAPIPIIPADGTAHIPISGTPASASEVSLDSTDCASVPGTPVPVSATSLNSSDYAYIPAIPRDASGRLPQLLEPLLDPLANPSIPRTPSGSTGHIPASGIPADLSGHAPVAEIPTPQGHAPVPSSESSETDSFETQLRQTRDGQVWVPTALFGRPEPSIRPSNPRE